MKTLFNLYCDDSIRTHYLQSMSPHVPLAFQEQFYEQWQLEQWETALVDEIPIPTPSFRDSLSFSHLNLAERQAAYQRFYRALCSTWLLFDDLWSIRVSRHPSVLATKDAFDVFTQDRWVDNKISDLHEKIEVVEVLEFVWLFLVRKLFPNPDELTAYFLAAGHEFLPDAERSTSVAAKWIYGLQWLVIYLRPPHIIELFIDICNSGERAINMPDYLKSLGLSDELFGLPEGDTTHHYPPPSLELHSIEFHGINRLIDGDDKIILPYHMGWLHEWGIYFYGRWASDLRGKPIFFPQPTDKLIRHIKED